MIISYRDIGDWCLSALYQDFYYWMLSKFNTYYKVYYQLHKIDGDVTSKKVTTVSGTASTVTQTISPAADHLVKLLVVGELEGELVWHQTHDYTLQAGCTGTMADGREDVEVVV